MRPEQTCWRCGADGDIGLVCPDCAAVQPLAPNADLFTVLGLARRLDVDPRELERRYVDLSRAVHPDRFQTGTPRERELSLAASAAVNRAYRTLRDPVARGRYWLELHGARLGDDPPRVPPAIAAEVFETQEKLAALRSAGDDGRELRRDVEELHNDLATRLGDLRDALVSGYAADIPLDDLKGRLAEIAYLRTRLGDVEDAIGEGFRATDHRH